MFRKLMTGLFLLTLVTSVLSACGQAGPLYLPKHAPSPVAGQTK